jgi:ribosomal protein S18 acetylase RimI-like enzyme
MKRHLQHQGEVSIRPARPADAPAIAAVHIRAWQTAYRGIVPDSHLDALDVVVSEKRWLDHLTHRSESECSFVAEVNGHAMEEAGAIIGFATGGPERHGVAGYDGELYAIYLLLEQRGKGIGRQLVATVARWLSERGMKSLVIWVLKENVRGRGFYEALGGQIVGEQTITIGGSDFQDVAYGWTDLRKVAHAAQGAEGDPDEADPIR